MFNGLCTALVTPFCSSAVDIDSLKKLLDYQIFAGVDSFLVLGTTGEAPTISDSERDIIIKYVVNHVAGSAKVMVGASSNSTAQVVKYAKQAKSLGADCILVSAPYYNKPTQSGILAHYQTICQSTDIPIIIYNIPGRAAVNISDETIAQIASLKNVIGIKDATGDISRPLALATLLEKSGNSNFIQLTGNDDNAVAFNVHGGQGCISVTANIAPKLCKRVQELTASGKYVEALLLQRKLLELHNAMFCETNPAPIKYAAYSLDLIESSELRLPLVQISEQSQRTILNAIHSIGDDLC
ncbi:4-hydroxy-tetrahydrodipicolinate synthase [Candidatus Lariskella endosymbiont of Hedychridium roseum]|uniref:4-hydroxy-tetrahydrodipicolinate synthase n=1 Tax=Candidatus Lariskella endosymbiont of Hedychridium roseum TaxID=3077949 RepID=UPI0030D1E9C2